ncbi:MAG TPA: tetratricopeptide repeat protein [candidate division Zixibacteria bacterium]|nr:tetratricopeptide repeat protein [candidate division Zixibacteria bacterium]
MKNAHVALLAALCFATFSTGAYADLPEPKSERVNPDVEAARKAIDAKNYKAALSHLAKAVQELPNDADVHNMLGYSYRKTNQLDKAMEHYRTALKLDPNHRGAHEYLGELYLDLNQVQNAEKQLQALKKSCPFFGRCDEYEDLRRAIEKHKARK